MMKKIVVLSVFLLIFSGCTVYVDDGPPPSQSQSDKVTICHKGKTKVIPRAALKGHLKHGDTIGPCR